MISKFVYGSLLALHFCLTSCAQETSSILRGDLTTESGEVRNSDLRNAKADEWREGVDWEVSRMTWGIGSVLAKATLVPWERNLHLKVHNDSGSNEINIPLEVVEGERLHRVSLGLLGPTTLVVGANIAGTSSGKILAIDFEEGTPEISPVVSTLYSGSSFAWPSSIFANPDKPSVIFVFDEASHSALAFDRGSGGFSVVGDPLLAPSLLKCRFIQAGPSVYTIPETGEKIDSWTVRCSPTESADPFYTQNTYLIDISNDSITDFVELSQ